MYSFYVKNLLENNKPFSQSFWLLCCLFLLYSQVVMAMEFDFYNDHQDTTPTSKSDFSQAQKLSFLKPFSTFIVGELKANQLDLEHAIACFEKGENGADNSCKEVLFKAPNYIAAFKDMRLYLALSKAERWNEPNLAYRIEGTPTESRLKDKMTLSLKHLFGNYELSFLMSVPIKEELQPLAREEIEQALLLWEIDTLAADQELVEWYAQNNEKLQKGPGESERAYNLRNGEDIKLERKWKWRYSYRLKAYKKYREKYFEQIKKYPLIIFLRAPELPKLEWQDPQTPEFQNEIRTWYPMLAEALKKALTLNNDLLDKVLEIKQQENFDLLLSLMGFKGSLDKYLTVLENKLDEENESIISHGRLEASFTDSKFPLAANSYSFNDYEGLVAQLIDDFDDAEFYQDMKFVTLIVAAGVFCMVGPSKITKIPLIRGAFNKWSHSALAKFPKLALFAVCTLGTGILANSLFYDITLGRYQQSYSQVFASPNSHRIFAEFSDYQGRDLELLFENLFYFVGTGIPEFSRKMSPYVQNILKGVIQRGNNL